MVVGNQFLEFVQRALKQVENPPTLIAADAPDAGALFLADLMADASPDLESALRKPNDPAFWMYTSGTTGTPKAAIHCHRTVFMADSFLVEILGAGPEDRIFCSSKLFFAFALSHCYLGALRIGATVILYPDWPSPEAVAETVERFHPTIMLSVPTFYRNLLASGLAEAPAFKHVRHYISAGEKLPETIFERWLAKTGQPIKDGIGATETCFLFMANRGGEYRPGSCGKPVPGAEVKLVGENGEEITEPNKPGILWVRTLSVAGGYWNMPDKTRAAFKNGWYRTGDMFERDADGWYWHAGRGDDMLKVSGQWVSPGEIEDFVLRIPKVQDAAVVGVPNEDGLTRLALFLVAPEAKGRTEDLENEIRDTLTSNLSIYKCPRRMFFMDGLPMTATGKVQRYALRQMVTDGSLVQG